MTLYTIGHSTRELSDFLDLLDEHGIERLVDVRRFPGSRRHPHFGSEALRRSLEERGLEYRHAPELGGRRASTSGESPNGYWRNDSFRAYADYMATPQFAEALMRLLQDAASLETVIMCAEAVPWRCHRNLVSDAVSAAGLVVTHILEPGKTQRHVLNPAARRLAGGGLVYPAPEEDQQRLSL